MVQKYICQDNETAKWLKMSVGMNSWLQQIRLSLPFSIRGLPLCDNLSASLQVVKKSDRETL